MFTEPWYIVFFDIYVKYKRNWINWQLKERTVYTAGVNGLSFLPKKHPNALHNSKITQKCFKRIVKVVRCGFYFLYIKFYIFHSLTHTILLRSVSKINWFKCIFIWCTYETENYAFCYHCKVGTSFYYLVTRHLKTLFIPLIYLHILSTNLYCSKKLPWWHSRNM